MTGFDKDCNPWILAFKEILVIEEMKMRLNKNKENISLD